MLFFIPYQATAWGVKQYTVKTAVVLILDDAWGIMHDNKNAL